MKNQRRIYFLLTLVAGVVILFPLLDFQALVAQGDHGRDLYAFKKTMQGAWPCRDYFWPFGPLMPFYYSFFYWLFGISIQSALWGQFGLILIAGLLVYLICVIFLSPMAAFTAAFWYWAYRGQEFFYTYNHQGGQVMLLLSVYFVFRYIRDSRRVYVVAGAASIFLLCLIRLNIGLSSLLAFFLSLWLTDVLKKEIQPRRNLRYYFWVAGIILAAVGGIYWFLIHPLPGHLIQQCFPYGKAFRIDDLASISQAVSSLLNILRTLAMTSPVFKAAALGVVLGALCLSYVLAVNPQRDVRKIHFTAGLWTLGIFILATLHEFLASGTFYRLYWLQPMAILLIFHLFFPALASSESEPRKARAGIIFRNPYSERMITALASSESEPRKARAGIIFRNPYSERMITALASSESEPRKARAGIIFLKPYSEKMMTAFELGKTRLIPVLRSLLIITMLAAACQTVRIQHLLINNSKREGKIFPAQHGHVYVANETAWLTTVRDTTDYLNSHLKNEEKFLAVPDDPIFYFLTGKDSPTWELVFFQYHNMPPQEEMAMIRELESQKVNYVLISNRSIKTETGLETFGTHGCRILAQYINSHFETVAVFGDWVNPAGWAWNYGVKILKRVKTVKK